MKRKGSTGFSYDQGFTGFDYKLKGIFRNASLQ